VPRGHGWPAAGDWLRSALIGEWRGFAFTRITPESAAALAYLRLADGVVVVLGWQVLGERLTAPMLAGIALVIGSVAFLPLFCRAARR
jgi:hypothetical protein